MSFQNCVVLKTNNIFLGSFSVFECCLVSFCVISILHNFAVGFVLPTKMDLILPHLIFHHNSTLIISYTMLTNDSDDELINGLQAGLVIMMLIRCCTKALNCLDGNKKGLTGGNLQLT